MHVRRWVPLVMGAALVLAACGSDDDGDSADTTAAGGAETTAAAGGETTAAGGGGAAAGDCVVGVSWNNYQEERWAKWDEPALKEAIEAGGSSLSDHIQPDGSLGYFQHRFKVYDREGEPCPRRECNGVIARRSASRHSIPSRAAVCSANCNSFRCR